MKTLSKYAKGVGPGSIASSGNGLSTAPTTVQYLLILIDSADLDAVGELITQTVEIVRNHDGIVLGMDASLIFVTLNLPNEPSGYAPHGVRSALVSALAAQLGQSISIVHGVAEGRSGTVGSESIMSWTVLLPNFRETLRVLASLPAGEARELR